MADKNTITQTPTKQTLKKKMKWKVFAVLAFVCALFVVVYVPEELLTPLTTSFHLASIYVAKAGIAGVNILLLRWILFAQDHLATGNSRSSQFFRHYYPSNYAVTVYRLTRADADKQWFEFFNQWEDPQHPQHLQYEYSLERSYGCRVIYYLQRILFFFVLLAIVGTILCLLLGTVDARSSLPVRLVVAVGAFSVAVWLEASNKITEKKTAGGTYDDRYDATGAYFKYKEQQGILRSYFEQEVLKRGAG